MKEESELSSVLRWTMALGICISVANIYYNQPLLADMMKDFQLSQQAIGWVPILTLLGYSLGLLWVVPLGDMLEKKITILVCLSIAMVFLIFIGLSQNPWELFLSSLGLGIFSVTPQLMIPFAAQLSRGKDSGKVVGFLMSGLLVGILLSRTFSGWIGLHMGWRWVYFIAAFLIFILIWILYFRLPQFKPEYLGNYQELFGSLFQLIRKYPSLRESAMIGFFLFAAFNLFWSTLVFILKTPPYHYGSDMAGYFGLIGAAGAIFAPILGKLADQKGPRFIIGLGILLEILSFFLLWLGGNYFPALILFVVLMDLAQQGSHISNQSKVFKLDPESRSRMNTIYMFSAFIGGSMGSAIGSWAFSHFGLKGLAGSGMGLVFLALIIFSMKRFSNPWLLSRKVDS